jgi:hypothetical protein
MSKLFAFENDTVEDGLQDDAVAPSLSEEIDSQQETLDIVTEALKTASSDLLNVQHIRNTLVSKKLASVEYFTAIEDYSPLLTNISNNLGVKLPIPSLEDFKNPYGTQASHEIAIEGLMDYVRKLWDKIRDVFITFFKKINMFLRRLMGYELDLQTYEKYLDSAMPKLKSSKPQITDNKALLESKLPSFTAREGMEQVSVEYILSETDRRFSNLINIMNVIFIQNLPKLVKEDFNNLHTLIKTIIETSPEVMANDQIITQLETDIAQYCENTLTRIFVHSGIRINDNDLPEKVYDDLQFNFDRNEMGVVNVHSLINSNNVSEALPKNYNCFFTTLPGKKICITSSVETNNQVNNHLLPIANVENLIRFYEQYKKYSKELNLKKLDTGLSVVEDCIDKITQLMRNQFSKRLEELNKATLRTQASYGSVISAIQGMFEIEKQLSADDDLTVTFEINERFPNYGMYRTKVIDIDQFERMLVEERLDKEFIRYVESVHTRFLKPEGLSDEDRKAFIQRLESLQKYLINFLNNLQSALKDLSVNLAGTSAELRLEILKYAYGSMKLYNV